MNEENKKVRIDKYLWCIRIFKTRNMAAEAIDKGKVKLNGENIKASKNVVINDKIDVKTEARKWIIEVTGIIDKRVAYKEAIKNYKDLTPPEDLQKDTFMPSSFHTGKRLSKIGRPTKKDRRNIDNFFDE